MDEEPLVRLQFRVIVGGDVHQFDSRHAAMAFARDLERRGIAYRCEPVELGFRVAEAVRALVESCAERNVAFLLPDLEVELFFEACLTVNQTDALHLSTDQIQDRIDDMRVGPAENIVINVDRRFEEIRKQGLFRLPDFNLGKDTRKGNWELESMKRFREAICGLKQELQTEANQWRKRSASFVRRRRAGRPALESDNRGSEVIDKQTTREMAALRVLKAYTWSELAKYPRFRQNAGFAKNYRRPNQIRKAVTAYLAGLGYSDKPPSTRP